MAPKQRLNVLPAATSHPPPTPREKDNDMYYADVFNSRGFFQNTGGWLSIEHDAAIQHHIHVVLARAYRALFNIDQASLLHGRALDQLIDYGARVSNHDGFVHVSSPVISGLLIEICDSLAALRIVQNELWELISVASRKKLQLRADTPSSLHDAVQVFKRKYRAGEKRPAWLQAIDANIRKDLVTYWDAHGSQLKDYRDLDQHFEIIATNGFLHLPSSGGPSLSVPLPDNPTEKSPHKFKYDMKIDAIQFTRNAFMRIHELAENVARLLNGSIQPTPLQRLFSPLPSIQHRPGVARTTAIVIWDLDGQSVHIIGQTPEMQMTTTVL